MRTMFSIVLAGVAGVLIAGTPTVMAHHAFGGEFDANRPVLLKGKVDRKPAREFHPVVLSFDLITCGIVFNVAGRAQGGRSDPNHVSVAAFFIKRVQDFNFDGVIG